MIFQFLMGLHTANNHVRKGLLAIAIHYNRLSGSPDTVVGSLLHPHEMVGRWTQRWLMMHVVNHGDTRTVSMEILLIHQGFKSNSFEASGYSVPSVLNAIIHNPMVSDISGYTKALCSIYGTFTGDLTQQPLWKFYYNYGTSACQKVDHL